MIWPTYPPAYSAGLSLCAAAWPFGRDYPHNFLIFRDKIGLKSGQLGAENSILGRFWGGAALSPVVLVRGVLGPNLGQIPPASFGVVHGASHGYFVRATDNLQNW